MSNAITKADESGAIERVLVDGDLSALSASQRVQYYQRVCESLRLNPLTKPFDYIKLNGKLVLYAKRDCTDQMRRVHGVSVTIVSRERVDDAYVVTARAATPDGRVDESIGAVPLGSAKGEALANALMKAETKAKRRVTLSIVGLGILDESEVDSVASAQRVTVTADGEVVEPARVRQLHTAKLPLDADASGKLAVELGEQLAACVSRRTADEANTAFAEASSAVVKAHRAGLISEEQRVHLRGIWDATKRELETKWSQ